MIIFPLQAQDADDLKEKKSDKRRKHFGTEHFFKMDFGLNNYLENGKFPDQNGI